MYCGVMEPHVANRSVWECVCGHFNETPLRDKAFCNGCRYEVPLSNVYAVHALVPLPAAMCEATYGVRFPGAPESWVAEISTGGSDAGPEDHP